jgi:hypothetical protein
MLLIQNRNTTEEMKNYMSSPKWKALVRPERLLFQAANHSFDLTMDKLGHHNVAQRLKVYRHAQKVARERCGGNFTRLPCSSTGEYQNESETDCLKDDMGLGFECLDQVAISLGISEQR